jgi:iron complex outermembrane receptor protein
MVGLKFTPSEILDLHVSFSRSPFPNMRAMYSPSSGNPDLLSERDELRGRIHLGIRESGSQEPPSPMSSRIDRLDHSEDGTKRYWNVGKAPSTVSRSRHRNPSAGSRALSITHYIDGRNDTDDLPLDAMSDHNVNFDLSLRPFDGLRLSVYGLATSNPTGNDYSARKINESPPISISMQFWPMISDRWRLFVKATNIFDDYIYTDPIFPWRVALLRIGARIAAF